MGILTHLFTTPLFWLVLIAIFVVLTVYNIHKNNRLKALNVESTLLMIEIPKDNDKKELAAEQLFASLHGILRDRQELKNSGGVQEHLSFEIASTGNQIRFFVWVPKILQSFVEGQIYSQYPSVQIYRMNEDYVDRRSNYPVSYSAEITLTDNEVLPISRVSRSIRLPVSPVRSPSSTHPAAKKCGFKSLRAQSPTTGAAKPTFGLKKSNLATLAATFS